MCYSCRKDNHKSTHTSARKRFRLPAYLYSTSATFKSEGEKARGRAVCLFFQKLRRSPKILENTDGLHNALVAANAAWYNTSARHKTPSES